ncbi:MAG: SAM-dependent chlorinase/fluorinase [Planctomycetes bacterium]|nr:SAM-dependent chlorinase/fluorinase [Planctomycetota bacterium]
MSKLQPTITLITDFGLQDGYAGVMKGVITGINPSANIIDISNTIEAQNIFQAAYVLSSSYKYFPKGTIHTVVVDPGVGSERNIICLKTDDYLFLAPDNGALSFIVSSEKPSSFIRVTNKEFFLPKLSNTFHGRDIFAPVAAYLSKGINHQKLGENLDKIRKIDLPKPIRSRNGTLTGEIIHVDHFGNLISNISSEIINQMRIKPRELSIIIGGKRINKLSTSYTDVKEKDALAIIGSTGFLEISVNRGSATNTLKLNKGDNLVLGTGENVTISTLSTF